MYKKWDNILENNFFMLNSTIIVPVQKYILHMGLPQNPESQKPESQNLDMAKIPTAKIQTRPKSGHDQNHGTAKIPTPPKSRRPNS